MKYKFQDIKFLSPLLTLFDEETAVGPPPVTGDFLMGNFGEFLTNNDDDFLIDNT